VEGRGTVDLEVLKEVVDERVGLGGFNVFGEGGCSEEVTDLERGGAFIVHVL
jgi:hypothetical protein